MSGIGKMMQAARMSSDVVKRLKEGTRGRFPPETQKQLDRAIKHLGQSLIAKPPTLHPGAFLDLIAGSLGPRYTHVGVVKAFSPKEIFGDPLKTYVAFAFAFDNIVILKEARDTIDPYIPYETLTAIGLGANELVLSFDATTATGVVPQTVTLKEIAAAELERFAPLLADASGVPIEGTGKENLSQGPADAETSIDVALGNLVKMRSDGLLTEGEFAAAKKKLLNS